MTFEQFLKSILHNVRIRLISEDEAIRQIIIFIAQSKAAIVIAAQGIDTGITKEKEA